MASIKRRRGKYHVVYYYLNEDGEKKQKWESFDTEAEAKHRKAEIEYKQGSRTFIAPSKTTVAAFLDDFVSLYGTKKWSPSTYEANTGLIRNYINPKLGSTLMQDAHILDEDRKVNAQKFESAFYANPDLRGVQAPAEPSPALDVQSIILQLQQSPELLSALTSLISNQGCK